MTHDEYEKMLIEKKCPKCGGMIVVIPQPYKPGKLQAVCCECGFKNKED